MTIEEEKKFRELVQQVRDLKSAMCCYDEMLLLLDLSQELWRGGSSDSKPINRMERFDIERLIKIRLPKAAMHLDRVAEMPLSSETLKRIEQGEMYQCRARYYEDSMLSTSKPIGDWHEMTGVYSYTFHVISGNDLKWKS